MTLGTSAAALWSRTRRRFTPAGTIAAAAVVVLHGAAPPAPARGADDRRWLPPRRRAPTRSRGSAGRPALRPARSIAGGRRRRPRSSARFRSSPRVEGGTLPPFAAARRRPRRQLSRCWLWPTTTIAGRTSRVAAVAPAWLAVLQWQGRRDLAATWPLAPGARGRALRRVRRLSTRRRPAARDSTRSVLRGDARQRDGFLRRPRRVRRRRSRLDDRRRSRCRRRGARGAAAHRCSALEPAGQRDLGRLALVAGAALAFVTVAIPLQLEPPVDHDRLGARRRGAGVAVSHAFRTAVCCTGRSRCSARSSSGSRSNPEVLVYEPRGAMRIFNWYLYTYLICAAAMLLAAWWLSRTDDRLAGGVRVRRGAAGGGDDPAVPAAQHRDRRLLRDRPDDHVPVRRHARAGPDLHDRLARLRDGAADRRHLPRQPAGARRRRRADRRHDLQVLPLRSRLARRAALASPRSSAWRFRSRSCRSRCRSSCCRSRGARREASRLLVSRSRRSRSLRSSLAQPADDSRASSARRTAGAGPQPPRDRCGAARRRRAVSRRCRRGERFSPTAV